MTITYDIERKCRELIDTTCVAMDKEDFTSYLAACHPQYTYAIRAYSPEIRRDMTWLEKDASGLKDLLGLMPKQNRDRTPLTRHFCIQSLQLNEDSGDVTVKSSLQVYRNSLDGGEVTLYAVGSYVDVIGFDEGHARLKAREVRLETRSLGTGYHVPF